MVPLKGKEIESPIFKLFVFKVKLPLDCDVFKLPLCIISGKFHYRLKQDVSKYQCL